MDKVVGRILFPAQDRLDNYLECLSCIISFYNYALFCFKILRNIQACLPCASKRSAIKFAIPC